jgi:hypothetical protein
MWVAGGNVGAGLGDADHRLARLQLLEGEAVGQEALQVERDDVDLVGIVEPVLGTEAPRLRADLLGHGFLPGSSRDVRVELAAERIGSPVCIDKGATS